MSQALGVTGNSLVGGACPVPGCSNVGSRWVEVHNRRAPERIRVCVECEGDVIAWDGCRTCGQRRAKSLGQCQPCLAGQTPHQEAPAPAPVAPQREVELGNRLLALLAKGPHMTGQLSKRLGDRTPHDVRTELVHLRGEGRVHSSGEPVVWSLPSTTPTYCSEPGCPNFAAPGTKYCSRECSNKVARRAYAERRRAPPVPDPAPPPPEDPMPPSKRLDEVAAYLVLHPASTFVDVAAAFQIADVGARKVLHDLEAAGRARFETKSPGVTARKFWYATVAPSPKEPECSNTSPTANAPSAAARPTPTAAATPTTSPTSPTSPTSSPPMPSATPGSDAPSSTTTATSPGRGSVPNLCSAAHTLSASGTVRCVREPCHGGDCTDGEYTWANPSAAETLASAAETPESFRQEMFDGDAAFDRICRHVGVDPDDCGDAEERVLSRIDSYRTDRGLLGELLGVLARYVRDEGSAELLERILGEWSEASAAIASLGRRVAELEGEKAALQAGRDEARREARDAGDAWLRVCTRVIGSAASEDDMLATIDELKRALTDTRRELDLVTAQKHEALAGRDRLLGEVLEVQQERSTFRLAVAQAAGATLHDDEDGNGTYVDQTDDQIVDMVTASRAELAAVLALQRTSVLPMRLDDGRIATVEQVAGQDLPPAYLFIRVDYPEGYRDAAGSKILSQSKRYVPFDSLEAFEALRKHRMAHQEFRARVADAVGLPMLGDHVFEGTDDEVVAAVEGVVQQRDEARTRRDELERFGTARPRSGMAESGEASLQLARAEGWREGLVFAIDRGLQGRAS